MKRQFIAFLMISIMALTVCSAVSVSAAPTSAQPQQQTGTVQTSPSAYRTVHVGTNELWTGWQYNYHDAYGFIETGTGTHAEKSVFNVLSTNLAWRASSDYSETSIASVGVQFRLAGKITPQQWQKLSQTPVIIRTTVPYCLKTTSGGAARLVLEPANWYYNFYPITSAQGRTVCGVGTAEARLTLGNVVRETSAGSGVYAGVIQVFLQSYPSVSPTSTTGRASGVAVVSDIQLVWPKTAL
jgi:hypothetical protein